MAREWVWVRDVLDRIGVGPGMRKEEDFLLVALTILYVRYLV